MFHTQFRDILLPKGSIKVFEMCMYVVARRPDLSCKKGVPCFVVPGGVPFLRHILVNETWNTPSVLPHLSKRNIQTLTACQIQSQKL